MRYTKQKELLIKQPKESGTRQGVALADADARHEAVDPKNSFIVSAPAGSGKTALLTLRCLNLLALANRPEEILCITFTRKAAGEMRERIIDSIRTTYAHYSSEDPSTDQNIDCDDEALDLHVDSKSSNSYAAQLKRASIAVLKNDIKHGWRLLDNPARLNVTTIDSFCARIARERPMSNRLYGNLPVEAEPDSLYEAAAKECITYLAVQKSSAFSTLLGHYNGDIQTIERLLTLSLKQRSNWMHIITALEASEGFENYASLLDKALEDWATEICDALQTNLFLAKNELIRTYESLIELHKLLEHPSELLSYHRSGAQDSGTDSRAKLDLFYRPLIEFFTTNEGIPRKRFDKRDGVPTVKDLPEIERLNEIDYFRDVSSQKDLKKTYDAFKKDLLQFAQQIPTAKQGDLIVAALLAFPREGDAPHNESVTAALLELLRPLLAHLQLIFDQQGVVDFTEIAGSAIQTLADGDVLAQKLDSQISHILIDEFQDTSQQQFQLLQNLVREWQPYDGRTLFLVGDAMQSCYRFRDADVGLFIDIASRSQVREQAQSEGKNTLSANNSSDAGGSQWQTLVALDRIKARRLSTNFRSSEEIINFNNILFNSFFPERSDAFTGAVQYEHSESPTTEDNFKGQQTPLDLVSKEHSNDRSAENFPEHVESSIQFYDFITERKNNSDAFELDSDASDTSDTSLDDELFDFQELAEVEWLADHLHQQHQSKKQQVPSEKIEADNKDSAESIAVLCRGKKPLRALARILQRKKVPYQAQQIDTIFDRAHIQDIYYLARVITQKHDRLAWLTVLRAPWCGIDNKDLYAIANHPAENSTDADCVYSSLQNLSQCETLSAEGYLRVNHFFALYQKVDEEEHLTLDTKLRSLWMKLGGQNCLFSEDDYTDISRFFELLVTQQQALWIEDWQQFEQRLKSSTSSTRTPNAQIELMTIHKSKGLQFDHVYVMGLGNKLRSDDKQLFAPVIRHSSNGDRYLIGIEQASRPSFAQKQKQSLYDLIGIYKRRAASLEERRLLYVACTRAKTSLTLLQTKSFSSKKAYDKYVAKTSSHDDKIISELADVSSSLQDDVDKPSNIAVKKREERSFAELVASVLHPRNAWNTIDLTNFSEGLSDKAIETDAATSDQLPQWERHRLKADKRLARFKTPFDIYSAYTQATPQSCQSNPKLPAATKDKPHLFPLLNAVTDGQNKLRQAVPKRAYDRHAAAEGIVMHRVIKRAALDESFRARLLLDNIPTDILSMWALQLKQENSDKKSIDKAVERISHAVKLMLTGKHAKLLFENQYAEDLHEYRLYDGRQLLVIDRSFLCSVDQLALLLDNPHLVSQINNENSVRVIIDYKTAVPSSCSLSDFLNQQTKLYRSQLNRYKQAFEKQQDFVSNELMQTYGSHSESRASINPKRHTLLALYFPYIDTFHLVR